MNLNRRDFFKKTTIMAAGTGAFTLGLNETAYADHQKTKKTEFNMIDGLVLLTIKQKDGKETLAIKDKKGILDVVKASYQLHLNAPSSLDQALQEGWGHELKQLVNATQNHPNLWLKEDEIQYGKLFKNPGKIVCVGLNYRRHAHEIGMQFPRVPPLFNKYNNSLLAANGVIPTPDPAITHKLDYETELVIVIGKRAFQVAENEALNYVAGYATGQDFSARDLQLELPAGQWMIGKTLEGFAPIGPYMVSADLIKDPNNLSVETWVNGEKRQSSNTSDFIFNTQQMISYVSQHFPLEAGDIVFTGTPEGVILGKPKDKQVWLKKGDKVVSKVGDLGELQFSLG
ncbi:fumarylacetoacetate hydrolase family protein [Ferrovum sp. PN-J185]|uniref:fumarylacetoacetate hydrolase family protein n=1 Tax=Ferrovum sp. PN-J185 TaxID=1356306 RepID=UPI000797528F|nr:fumarylacetoacetate hydrolase family protein [Ferrovum sp. PN-J185]KXW56729.1 ureidoglycolate lyase [Ferrovum sp. PN-J185]MCC6067586.1 fumarylacetoacetate hydrolase family protein [Ferrovum sp. PN-J185]